MIERRPLQLTDEQIRATVARMDIRRAADRETLLHQAIERRDPSARFIIAGAYVRQQQKGAPQA